MSVPQGSFERMTELRFEGSAVAEAAVALELSASQAAVAALDSSAIATVYGVPGSGKTVAVKALSTKVRSLKSS